MQKIQKCVIPAAGFGTRLLPATKSQPKEMIPVGRKPVIQYVVEEAAFAGVKEVLIITGAKKRSIEDHFDTDNELCNFLKDRKKEEYLKEINLSEKLGVQFFFTRQPMPKGLGDAVKLAKKFVNEEPFILSLGDTIIISKNATKKSLLEEMIQIYLNKKPSALIAVEEVPLELVSRYGIIKGEYLQNNLYNVTQLIEKPSIKETPSRFAIVGRYIFDSEIFDAIQSTPIGKSGEYQLTDAISILLEKNKSVMAYALDKNAIRYDIGNYYSYAKAFIDICLADPEIGTKILEYIRKKIIKT
ncbi:MAG: UTP--glucose-1-phosphate uridylyltransferase [Candidatus Helarchaeota archaeon]